MNEFIKEKSLSVGYKNSNGQEFFNILNERRKWIESYFFSVGEEYIGNDSLNIEDEINKFRDINTYDIPGNLLFNSFNLRKYMENNKFIDIINELSSIINLKKVTVLNRNMALLIKNKFPDLEIHTSVRYFESDWDRLDISNYPTMVKEWMGISDVMNLNAIRSLTDYDLIEYTRKLGFKIKWIVNEGCISMHEDNFRSLPGFENRACHEGHSCSKICFSILKKYPWMVFSKLFIYKEFLKYIDYDILKLSCRNTKNENVKFLIDYYISPDKTEVIRTPSNPTLFVNSDKSYDEFLKYIELRSKCSLRCGECRECEAIYNNIIELNKRGE